MDKSSRSYFSLLQLLSFKILSLPGFPERKPAEFFFPGSGLSCFFVCSKNTYDIWSVSEWGENH